MQKMHQKLKITATKTPYDNGRRAQTPRRDGEKEGNMNKKTKEVKSSVLTSIKSAVGALFKESEEATPLVYQGMDCETTEEPGTYNKHMTWQMVRDMMQLSMFLMKDDPKASEAVRHLAKAVEEKDLAIRRMFDDRKDHRPIIEYPYGNSEKNIREMMEVAKSGILETGAYEKYREKAKAWVTRLLKLDILGYCLTAYEAIDKALSEADMRVYDDDGNIVHGISEEDAECVKIIIAMEQILLKALMRISGDSDEVQPTLGRIEIIDALIKAIVHEDEEMLDRMAKAVEAAKDFENEPEE